MNNNAKPGVRWVVFDILGKGCAQACLKMHFSSVAYKLGCPPIETYSHGISEQMGHSEMINSY